MSLLMLLLTLLNGFTTVSDCPNQIVYEAWGEAGNHYLRDVDSNGERQLLFENLATQPRWSPDGRHIVIALQGEWGKFTLLVISADEDKPRFLALGQQSFVTIIWSPDSNWITFDHLREAFVIRRDGTGLRRISADESAFFYPVSWSPDGRYISMNGAGFTGIQIYDMQTGENRIVAPVDVLLWDFPGGWSPDGNQFIFSHIEIGNYPDTTVFSYFPETGELREFLPRVSDVNDSFLSWSPDGNSIFFDTNRFEQESSIQEIALNGELIATYSNSFVRMISWNPDRTQFVYEIVPERDFYIVNWITGDITLQTEDQNILHENYSSPRWSPSGDYIAYEAISGDDFQLFIMNVETNEFRQVTFEENGAGFGRWQWLPCNAWLP